MLNQMRALSQNFVGRTIMGIVLGFIILSFAIWGIGDRFTGYDADQLATVGSARLSVQQYRDAYQNQLRQMQEKAKRGITNEEARRLGLDRQVLSRLLSDTILDQEAAKLGLAVGDADIARMIVADDMFKGANGQFDRARFEQLMADNGLTEARYVKDERGAILRQDVSDAVVGGLDVPKATALAIHRYQSEVRDLTFFVLPQSAAGIVPAPTDADLKTYYDERPSTFVAPEYRKLVVLSVVPVNLVKPEAITDADVKARYDAMKDARFVVPEKRTVQQLVFADAKAAAAAKAKLDAGESFDQLIKDEKKSGPDVDLGTVPKSELNEKAVADAAFQLPDGGTSGPVATQFGTVLVHVAGILPMRQQPLADVAAQLRDELAIVRAKSAATTLRDKVEDQRTAGKTVAEAATAAGLTPRTIDAIDAQGFDKAHKPVEGLVDGPALLKAAFGSDVGSDTEMLQTSDGGYVWYEVQGIDPSHKLPLEAVKPRVAALWHNDEVARRLAAASDKLVAEINGGKPLSAVAAENGKLEVMQASNVSRAGAPGLPPVVTAAVFDVAAHKAGSASDPGSGRIVFAVDAAKVPPINAADENFTKLMQQVKDGLVDDVIAQYLAVTQGEIGVKINQKALQNALGDSGS
jgi:peptidyl-prolyl cis-trans isomerase D